MNNRQTDMRFLEIRALLDDAEATGDPLSGCGLLSRASVQLVSLLVAEVATARIMMCSWEDISQELGITRQAAWKRYAGLNVALD